MRSENNLHTQKANRFNTSDLNPVLNREQLAKLEKELQSISSPVDLAMGETKDKVRRKILQEIKQAAPQKTEEDLTELLKRNIAEDISGQEIV